jgi:hypothetical protein
MSVKKGDMLIATNPYNGKKKKYKYLGKEKSKMLIANDFKRILVDRNGEQIIVSDLWAKTFDLKPAKKNG